MQSIRWLGFCVSQSMSRSLLHFFPSCENASAPYPATCTLTLLKPRESPARADPARGAATGDRQVTADGLVGQVERMVVTLDGGRLGHPDGLRLEDAFPILRTAASGMCGLEIEISTPQPRLDVSSSGCVLEVISQSQPVKYTPKKIPASRAAGVREGMRDSMRRERWADTRPPRQVSPSVGAEAATSATDSPAATSARPPVLSGLAVFDSMQCPSLVFVNGSQSGLVGAVFSLAGLTPSGASGSSRATSQELPIASVSLEPGAIHEVPLAENMFRGAGQRETVSAQGVQCEGPLGAQIVLPFCVEVYEEGAAASGVDRESVEGQAETHTRHELAIYLVHREIRTRRIVSVMAIDSGGNMWSSV
jgi:hypothetical protein